MKLTPGKRSADLIAESEGRRQRKGSTRLGSSQLGKILSLQLHHDVVEPVVAAAADEPAHVFAALELLQHGHLHFEHLLRLLRGLQLKRHLEKKNEINFFGSNQSRS